MLKGLHASLLVVITGVFLSMFATSCDKDMSVALDSDSVDALSLTTIDSMTPQIETVRLPSIPTSGNGAILLGGFSRNGIGSIYSTPYFKIAPETFTNDIPSGANFESIELILRPHPNRYFYGDTTQTQTITVHRLEEDLQLTTLTPGGILNTVVPIYVEQPSIFSHQTFTYGAIPLGTSQPFRPSVMPQRSVSLELDPAFGQELFGKIVNNATELQSESNFTGYLKGLAIVPDPSSEALIAYNDTVFVNINYSYLGSDGLSQSGTKRLVIRDYNYKYNQIDYDGTGTDFEDLTIESPVRQQETNGKAFYQAGIGAGVKINFPSLQEFLHTSDIAINKVELEVEVETAQQHLYPIWGAPILLVVDRQNIPISFVPIPFSPSAQQGQFIPGNNTGRNGRFVFNLIQYIGLINNPNHQGNSLVLSMGPISLFNTVSSAVIATENDRPKIKLNIFFTKFK